MKAIEDAIKALHAGESYAMAFQPRVANQFDKPNARYILRKLPTLGGYQIALAELHHGMTGSGIYGDEMILTIYPRMLDRMHPRIRAGLDDYEWRAFGKSDLPENLTD